MSVNSELACAARAVSAHVERLPEHLRPDVATLWGELLDEVDAARSAGAAELRIIEWRHAIESRLTQRLAHAPLIERT